LRVSAGVAQGNLITQVTPDYPQMARTARIQDTVILEATIGTDGLIKDLRVVRGHAMLVPAAEAAVRQWRYTPTMLNGQPVEVITTISVNFTLN
jgi:protein TonB